MNDPSQVQDSCVVTSADSDRRLELSRDRLTVLPNLLDMAACRSLSQHFDRLIAQKAFRRDPQTPGRLAIHNEPLARRLHHEFVDLVGFLVGQVVKASYCYSVIYRAGSELTRHTDRPQCEWTISLLVGSKPRGSARDWPIYFELPTRRVSVKLDRGDGVLFDGTKIPHWRDPMPNGCTARLMFFHFVDQSFSGSLD